MQKEALSYARSVCRIVPAELGEKNCAALAVAASLAEEKGL